MKQMFTTACYPGLVGPTLRDRLRPRACEHVRIIASSALNAITCVIKNGPWLFCYRAELTGS